MVAGTFYHTNATDLRGQILHNSASGSEPAASVRVDLFIWDRGQWVNWSYAITGQDGFYYFVNIQPGATFCVQVNGKFYPDNAVVVQTKAPHDYQDIPRIAT